MHLIGGYIKMNTAATAPVPTRFMDNSSLTITEIRFVSRVVTGLLTAAGLSCCLVGSAAGYEHGITRTPNVEVLSY